MKATKVADLLNKTADGCRLSKEEALFLAREADLLALGQAATRVVQKKFPDNLATFVIDRNINYTNICICRCNFCAFYRDRHHPEAYLLTEREILKRIEEAVEQGATQIMLQGGLHPDLDIEFFTGLLKKIKANFSVTVHSFSPPEIFHMATISGISIRSVLQRLIDAGLDSLPGGGAEILVDEVRDIISPNKISSSQWLEVMETAHLLGLSSTATMMIGTVETWEDRILHLDRIRALQDRTGGFRAFIPWSFCPSNTRLGGNTTSAAEYLRTLALSRLYLDNFLHIHGSWVTQGPRVGQVSLWFGANDLGSIMLEENVVRAAGANYRLTQDEMVRLIKAAGRIPALRDTAYNIIKIFE